jgi:hypothetical protein
MKIGKTLREDRLNDRPTALSNFAVSISLLIEL